MSIASNADVGPQKPMLDLSGGRKPGWTELRGKLGGRSKVGRDHNHFKNLGLKGEQRKRQNCLRHGLC